MSPQSFDELLMAARQGDNHAMAELVRQYEPEIRIVARVRLGKPLRAHFDSVDIVQSVHRSVMAGLRDERFDFSDPKGLVALAMTMVRRKVARHWRKLQRQQRLSDLGNVENSKDMLVTLCSGEADPASVAALRERADNLFTTMSEAERKLISLRLAGCTTAEAARTLGLDPDVTRVQLHRLRRRLANAGMESDVI